MRIISGSARGTKLFTLEGIETRPTLDRIKESLFSIVQNKLIDAEILDLFAGSGALGLECLSRGAKFCIFSDSSKKAIGIINQNIEKTKMTDKSLVIQANFENVLKKVATQGKKFDLIFLDPPYESNLIDKSIKIILELNLLKNEGIIIAETDQLELLLDKIKELEIEIIDIRKYGRVKLVFLNRKG